MALCTLPEKPTNLVLMSAHSILERSYESAEAFFDAFKTVRKSREAKGTPTDHEQDLLRAALVFAAAGLDSMVKQLVRDTLSNVISADAGAQAQFVKYVQSRLKRRDPVDLGFLAETIAAPDPSVQLRQELTKELTGSSLQSKDQLLMVASHFAIEASEISEDPNRLKVVFDARNEIAHEMDILLGQRNSGRRQRKVQTMREYASLILTTAVKFYSAVEERLGSSRPTHHSRAEPG